MRSLRFHHAALTFVFAFSLLLCLPSTAHAKTIYVGDSRTSQMALYIGAANADEAPYAVDHSVDTAVEDGNYIIAKSAMALDWLKETGLPRTSEILETGDTVVILVGVNSIPANGADNSKLKKLAEEYINTVKSYMSGSAEGLTSKQKKLWGSAKIYFATVTPVCDWLAQNNNLTAKNESIIQYNSYLIGLIERERESNPSLDYIDLYGYFVSKAVGVDITSGAGFRDGLHYNSNVSTKMYGYLNQQTKSGHWVETFTSAGWHKMGSTWYLADSNGQVLFGWQKVNGKYYWLGYTGAMATGWLKQNSIWYYLKASGAMAASQWLSYKGSWYYLKASGAMAASQLLSYKGSWYYLKAGGQMAHDESLLIKGKSYTFNSNGIMIG